MRDLEEGAVTPQESATLYEFPRKDPLRDTEVIKMMRQYYSAGTVDMFGLRQLDGVSNANDDGLSEEDLPEKFKAWLKLNLKAQRVSAEELREYGLAVPVALVRAPTKRKPAQFEALRFLHGIGGLKAQHMIVGSWFWNRKITQETIEQFCWNELNDGDGMGELLLELRRGGHIEIDRDGHITPTRAMLYRGVECVGYLIDVMMPICMRYSTPEFADKMRDWPTEDDPTPARAVV